MNKDEVTRINSRYNSRLDEFGVGIDALASGNRSRQEMRFGVLSEIGIQSGDSVLDIGCGFADLYPFLRKTVGEISYTGIDINSRIIRHAKETYPGLDLRCEDFQQVELPRYDWVVSTSSFNLKLISHDNYEFVAEVLTRMFELATKGVAIDFLTSYVDYQGNSQDAFYYQPEILFSLAKKLTRRVSLRHDYPLFDFCLYIYPDFESWGSA